MANVLVTIRTVDDQAAPVPIDDVLVRVYDALDVYITEGLTGAVVPGSGEVEFTLNGGDPEVEYILRLHLDGVSFPPAPTFTIGVTDPPDPDNTFEFVGHIGETGLVATFVTQSDDPAPVLLEGSRIRVYNQVDSYLTELDTDSNGEAELALEGEPDPGKPYIVRLRKAGWTFLNGPSQQVKVFDPLVPPDTNIFEFEASQPVLPESPDLNMCLLSGTLVDASLRPLKRLRLRFMPLFNDPLKISGFPTSGSPTIVGDKIILRESVFDTDENGYIEVSLPRKSTHDVHIHGYETPGLPTIASVYIPDLAGIRIEDVLFPYITSVDFDDHDISLEVGDSQELELTILGSNLQDVPGDYAHNRLEFTVSNLDVATVELVGGKLVVTAVSTGSAIIEVTRIADTWAPRVPDIPALTVGTVDIEVV